MTPLVFAARANDLESARVLLAAGADVNSTTGYGWSPLLVATQNRYYKLAPLPARARRRPRISRTRAAGSRSISPPTTATSRPATIRSARATWTTWSSSSSCSTRAPTSNARMKDSTETRTVFTNQWLDENGATAFLRAAQSGDLALMKLLLARGADPKLNTDARRRRRCTSPPASAGSRASPTSGRRDANARSGEDAARPRPRPEPAGRHRPHRAARRRAQGPRRGRAAARRPRRGAWTSATTATPTTIGSKLAGVTLARVDYADGLVRVGVQSAIPHPETGVAPQADDRSAASRPRRTGARSSRSALPTSASPRARRACAPARAAHAVDDLALARIREQLVELLEAHLHSVRHTGLEGGVAHLFRRVADRHRVRRDAGFLGP